MTNVFNTWMAPGSARWHKVDGKIVVEACGSLPQGPCTLMPDGTIAFGPTAERPSSPAAKAPQSAEAGWQLVPIEPTAEMCDAAVQRICYGPEGGFTRMSGPRRAWQAMLTAAPTLPVSQTPAAEASTGEEIGALTVSHFRGHLENIQFDYTGSLPDGSYRLYAALSKGAAQSAAPDGDEGVQA